MGTQEEIHNIFVALLSGDEKEIYKVLYKKKEIDDKTPKLRTEDENKMLKSLSNKMRKLANSLEYPERIQRGLEWTQLLKHVSVCLFVLCSLFFVIKFSNFSLFHPSLLYSTVRK